MGSGHQSHTAGGKMQKRKAAERSDPTRTAVSEAQSVSGYSASELVTVHPGLDRRERCCGKGTDMRPGHYSNRMKIREGE